MSASEASWAPLLTGVARDQALSVVAEIADALAGPAAEDDPRLAAPTLSQGLGGAAVFFAEAAGLLGDTARTTGLALCDRIIDAANGSPTPALYHGTTGAGWALSVAERRLEEPDEGESDVDEYVEAVLRADASPGGFDLVSGVVGLGVYCLERLPRESARRGLDLAVARLEERAEATPDGFAWRTRPDAMPEYRRDAFPDGYFDVGVAHGNAGVVAFLAEAARAGAAGARDLLAGAAGWLLAQRMDETPYGVYPSVVLPGRPPAAGRLAWCYGDPGVAAALLGAGDALESDELLGEARALALRCTDSSRRSGIYDAGLCHGAAGVAHILNRIGTALRDEAVLDLARLWFGEVLRMRRAGAAVAGFPALDRSQDPPVWRATAGLLEGAAGVGLAFVSALSPAEPRWDSMLLLARTHRP